ncbi:MAG TPA: TraM recognition domain-containing protein [Candidatus Rubrimentiphilum sp.]|nr:TraM recognition domain-containing protein [Candidatus Rubrimentiphilum sp.]
MSEHTFWGLVTWGVIGWLVWKYFIKPRQARLKKHAVAIELHEVTDQVERENEARLAEARRRGPIIDLAVGTGKLLARKHVSGVRNGMHVYQDAELAYSGTAVVGESGSGKTRCILQPWMFFWLKFPGAGLFAFAEKANFAGIIARIAMSVRRTSAQIHRIGPNHEPWAIARGLSPDSIANVVEIVLERGGGRSDTFFVKSAVNIVRRIANILFAISQLGPLVIESKTESGEIIERFELDYDLPSISKLARMDSDALEKFVIPEIRAAAAVLEAQGNADAKARIDANLPELMLFAGMRAEKQKLGISGTVDAVFGVWSTEEKFRRAFSGRSDFDLSVLERGHCVIFDLPKDEYPFAAELASLLALEQLKNWMRDRIRRSGDGEELNPVALVIDEFTNVASKQSAALFRWCRESATAPLIAFQNVEGLRAVMGRSEADGLLHNCATRILFGGSSDPSSIALVATGKSEVERESSSTQFGKSSGESSSHHIAGGSSGSHAGSSWSESTSTSLQERSVVDEQLLDSLVNHVKRGVPAENQIAEIVLRSRAGGRKITEVCIVKAWDPPSSAQLERRTAAV